MMLEESGSYKGYLLLVDKDIDQGTLATFRGEARRKDGNFVDILTVEAGSREEAIAKLKQQINNRLANPR